MSKPNSSYAGQAAYLLQRYFDDEITEQEGSVLLELWERYPELAADTLKNYETEHLMRFLARLETERHKLFAHTPLPASTSAFFRSDANASPVDSNFDFDSLARLADRSETLAKQSEDLPQVAAKTGPTAYRPVSRKEFLRNVLLLVFVLMLYIPLVYREFRSSPMPDEQTNRSQSFIATVVNDIDVTWTNDGGKRIVLGAPLDSQRLRFDSGTLELLFYDGVRCVVEGPADLILVDKKQLFTKQGRFSVDVPEQGKGFEIQTPGILIRDLGTQFFASVEEDRSELHVIKGLVETEKGGITTLFKTNQAVSFVDSELVQRMDAVVDYFVTKSEMQRRSELFYRNLFDRLTQNSDKNSFKGPVCEVNFAQQPIKDAMLYGGEIVDGPRPDFQAVRFIAETDRIRLKSLGVVDAVTALIWVRVDRLDYVMNPILMSEGNDRNGLVCHILPDGKMLVGIRFQSSHKSGIFETPVVFTKANLGRWVRIGLSIDGVEKRLGVYVDGDPVLFQELPQSGKINTKNVDVGSWKWGNKTNSRGHMLKGDIGPITVYDRMLSPVEIKNLP